MTSLGPEVIINFSGLKITNTLFTTFIVDLIAVGLVFFIYKNIKLIPGKVQSIAEAAVSYFYDLAEQLAEKRASVVFPWVMSFFLVILFTNILGLLPGVGSVGFFEKPHIVEQPKQVEKPSTTAAEKEVVDDVKHEEKNLASEEHGEENFIPLLRPATSDFNATFALAFVSLIVTHALSIRYTGLKDYLTRFFSLNPILLFVGLLEIVSEFIKMFSLSFRLFGNIFAGETVLHTISTIHPLSAFLVPIPFLLLESIVAIVQALVFSMLTLVFMSILIKPHHAEEH